MSEDGVAVHSAPLEVVVEHPAWIEALARVRAALAQPSAVVAIIGASGTGKTMMLRALNREAREAGRKAVLIERGDARAAPGERPDLVLIDEADRIGPEMVRSLLASGIRSVVLTAQPSFAGQLEALPHATVVPLRPLRPDEAMAFVRARAETLNQPGQLEDGPAFAIVASSGGIPRLLTEMLTATNFVAALYQAPHASVEHVREAALLREDARATGATSGAAVPEPPADAAAPPLGGRTGTQAPDRDRRWAETAESAPATNASAARRLIPRRLLAGAALLVLLTGAYLAMHPGRDAATHGRAPSMVAQADRPASPASAPSRQPSVAPPAPPAPPPAQPGPSEPQIAQADPPPARAEPLPVPAAPQPTLPPAAFPIPPVPAASTAAPEPPSEVASAATPSNAVANAAGVTPHVVLSYQEGDAGAERRSLDAVRALRAAGFVASDPVPLFHRVAAPGITYFFAEDEAGASSVSRALGGAFGESHAAPLPPNASLPRPGTIEIQVGSAPPTASRP